MRATSVLLVAVLLAVAGCGDDSDYGGAGADGDAPATQTDATARTEPDTTATDDADGEDKAEEPDGTEIVVRKSEFGPMLFDTRRQAIYIFQNDPKGETVCYDECAEAWPPVYTDGEPKAGKGVRQSLLGTVKRRGGKRQVTYADKPLYFYANEDPGQVLCHNVNLNGGLWWVVGPDGKRRP